VFDYRDEDVVEKIRAATGNALDIAIDTISEGKTTGQVAGAIGDKGGKVAIILPYESPRSDVKAVFSYVPDFLKRVRSVPSLPFVCCSTSSYSFRDQMASGSSTY